MRQGLTPNRENQTKALIIGAGIAGLLAARVLSEHYEHIQIVERDLLPEQPNNRTGAPQSFHLHRVMLPANVILQRLFPDLNNELLARGAVSTFHKTVQISNPFGHFESMMPAEEAACSRALLEWTLRQRVQALPNVQISSALNVMGLQTNHEHTRVTGVFVRPRGNREALSLLSADLVIDTSGHFSKITRWLQDLGYEVPEPERLTANLGYSTRYYKASPQLIEKTAGIVAYGHPEKRIRFSYTRQIENDQWQVILFGAAELYPATGEHEFEQQLRQTTHPLLAEIVEAEAEPISAPRGYRIAECRRQHFDQMHEWPAGLLVMGDALCNLDPIYGHGMCVAAFEAEVLASCLQEQERNPQSAFERRVLRSLQDAIEPAWWISAFTDLRWKGVTYSGQQFPKAVALLQSYMSLYYQEATRRVVEHFSQNSASPAPAADIFSPEPSLTAYTLMMGLSLAPTVIFNAMTYRQLLEIEGRQEEPHRLKAYTEAYHLPLEEILQEIIPHFAHRFQLSPVAGSDAAKS